MAISDGFCSYVHDDDTADNGRISQLANDIAKQFKMITGETLKLFLDKNRIEWGDEWRQIIYTNLSSTVFFPILTPRYFLSSECRREFHFFANSANRLGVEELILPLHYVNVPPLKEETPDDELILLIQQYQWVDWTDLRFTEHTSEKYRRGVFELADRLANANQEVEKKDSDSYKDINSDDDIKEIIEDEPEIVDRLAKMEETLPMLTKTIETITQDINLIGKISRKAQSDIKKRK